MQMGERRERNCITVLDDAVFTGKRFTAEILDDGKPGGKIEGKDFGRRETLLAQPLPIAMKGRISSASFAMAL